MPHTRTTTPTFHVRRDKRTRLYRVIDPRTGRVLTNDQGAELDRGGCRRKVQARRLASAASSYVVELARRVNEDRAAVAAGRRVGRTALRVADVDRERGVVRLDLDEGEGVDRAVLDPEERRARVLAAVEAARANMLDADDTRRVLYLAGTEAGA